jgi:hypothetical protein
MIELKTLYLVSVCVTALLGFLLLFVWSQHPAMEALWWWAAAEFALALGLALLGLRESIHHIPSIALANAVIALSAALFWTGARVLERRKPDLRWLFAGAVLWLAACLIPPFYGSINARTGLMAIILAAYTWRLAWELWQTRRARDAIRWALIVIVSIQGAMFLARLPAAIWAPIQEALPGVGSAWYTLHQFEIVLYKIAIVVLFIVVAVGRKPAAARPAVAAKPQRRRRRG